MAAHLDTLEQHDSLSRPLLVSAAMHGGVFALIALYTSFGLAGRVEWGDPHSIGASVGITAMSQLPMPARSGMANPVANPTESQVPAPPKPEPKKPARAPEPDAIPLRGREAPKKPTYMRSQTYAPYRAIQEKKNQLYSASGQALSSNMYGGLQGSGGVGAGTGTSFGNRFGWYRALLEQRVGQKWHTEDVDPRLQTAPVVIVTFEIESNGSVRNVRLMQGSGNRTLDYSAQRAINEAAPFPPLPQGYERDSAQIEFWFALKR